MDEPCSRTCYLFAPRDRALLLLLLLLLLLVLPPPPPPPPLLLLLLPPLDRGARRTHTPSAPSERTCAPFQGSPCAGDSFQAVMASNDDAPPPYPGPPAPVYGVSYSAVGGDDARAQRPDPA